MNTQTLPAVEGPVDRPVRPAAEARWYCLDRDGVAMLCKDEADARAQVIENDDCWPGRAPHRAALLGDVGTLHAELRHARDGLTKGRSRMREDNDRLRAALAELLACHTESAGWSMSMLGNRAEFDAMLERSQARLESAVGAAREALGPNVRAERPQTAQKD